MRVTFESVGFDHDKKIAIADGVQIGDYQYCEDYSDMAGRAYARIGIEGEPDSVTRIFKTRKNGLRAFWAAEAWIADSHRRRLAGLPVETGKD